MKQVMKKFPMERRQWICSDGQVFYDEKEATAHENYLENKKKSSYSETFGYNQWY